MNNNNNIKLAKNRKKQMNFVVITDKDDGIV